MLVEQVPHEKLVLLVPDGQVRSLLWTEIKQNETIAPPAARPKPAPVQRIPHPPPASVIPTTSPDREPLDHKDVFGSVLLTLDCQEPEKLSYLSRKDGAVRVPLASQNSQDVRLQRFSRYELHGSFPSVSLPRADGAMVIFVTPGSTGNNVLGKFMVGLGGAGVGASVGILIAAGFIGLVTSVTDPLTGKKTSDGTDLAKAAGVVGGISLALGGGGAALWATSGTKLTVSKE